MTVAIAIWLTKIKSYKFGNVNVALSLTRSTVLYFEWHHTFLHDVQVSASFHSSIKFPELGTRFFILVAQVLFAKLKKLFVLCNIALFEVKREFLLAIADLNCHPAALPIIKSLPNGQTMCGDWFHPPTTPPFSQVALLHFHFHYSLSARKRFCPLQHCINAIQFWQKDLTNVTVAMHYIASLLCTWGLFF